MPFQVLRAMIDKLILGLLQLHPLQRPLMHQEEVCITPFLIGYLLPTFAIYKGYTDQVNHIRRFKRLCEITAKSYALLLKKFSCLWEESHLNTIVHSTE